MLPYAIHGIIAEPLSTYQGAQKQKHFRIEFMNATVGVPLVPFLGNTYVVSLFPSTTLTGPEDHRTAGCSSRPAPHISAHTLSRTSTHTLSERDSIARAG